MLPQFRLNLATLCHIAHLFLVQIEAVKKTTLSSDSEESGNAALYNLPLGPYPMMPLFRYNHTRERGGVDAQVLARFMSDRGFSLIVIKV